MASQRSSFRARIGASILNADLGALGDECSRILDAGADYLHLDVMDGHFVPNLTFGHPVVQCLRTRPKLSKLNGVFFEMHMMVQNPEQWVPEMAGAGADQYTFHYESTQDVGGCIRKIREAGMKVGLAIKPNTAVEVVDTYADQVDLILIMTVEPGFGGQKFMTDMMPKLEYLRRKYPLLDLEVDGGIGPKTIDICAEAGANVIVSGTALMKNDNPADVVSFMKNKVDEVIRKSQLDR